MTNDTRARGFRADLTRQARELSLDPLRVLDRIASRLVQRERHEVKLTLGTLAQESWTVHEATAAIDHAIAMVAEEIATEDQEREQLHEAARDEMVPGSPEDVAAFLPRWQEGNRRVNDALRTQNEHLIRQAVAAFDSDAPVATFAPAIRVVVDESAEPDELGGGG